MTTPAGNGPVHHPPWSRRRRRALIGLGVAVVVLAVGALVLPAQVGVTAGLLAAVCALVLVAATVVFVFVPGPHTAATLLRSPSLGGAVAVVAVLLVLSTQGTPFTVVWEAVAGAAALWTATALWRARRSDR